MTEAELLTTFTDPNKTRFLSRLTVTHSRNNAAAAAGVRIEEVLRWMSHDPEFKKSVQVIEAMATADDFILPQLLDQVRTEMKRIGLDRLEVEA